MSRRDATIPLVKEELSIHTRNVGTGRVRVETITELSEKTTTTQLEPSEIEVRRVEIGGEVDHVPAVRVEAGVTIVPVLEEVLVVEKRLVLKEELHISKRVITEQTEVTVPLRKQRAIVTRDKTGHHSHPEGTDHDRDLSEQDSDSVL